MSKKLRVEINVGLVGCVSELVTTAKVVRHLPIVRIPEDSNSNEFIASLITAAYEAMVDKAEELKVRVDYVADTDQEEYYELIEKHRLIHERMDEITNFG